MAWPRSGASTRPGSTATQHENGERIVLASDRDFGLYIFQYTGPTP
jgi:hypothetical protein